MAPPEKEAVGAGRISLSGYSMALRHLERPIWYSAMVKHILSGSNANRMIAAIISLSAPTSLHLKKLGE